MKSFYPTRTPAHHARTQWGKKSEGRKAEWKQQQRTLTHPNDYVYIKSLLIAEKIQIRHPTDLPKK